MTVWNTIVILLLIALIVLVFWRTRPNQFGIETLAGIAMRLYEIEQRQEGTEGLEERIEQYLKTFHNSRSEAERMTQATMAQALQQTQQIRLLVEALSGTIPGLHARVGRIEAWQNGWTARVNEEIAVTEQEKH